MRNRNNKRRIYYIPGILSLLFLPIICIVYLKHSTINTDERVIEIWMPRKYNPVENGRNSYVFDTAVLSRPENIRKYREIKMTDNIEDNREKIAEFKQSVAKLVQTNDTLNGVHLTMSSITSYNEFIQLLDICFSSTTISQFVVYEDNLWYLYKKFDLSMTKRYKEEKLRMQNEKQKEKITTRNIELSQVTIIQRLESLYEIWPWIIVYLAFGFISVRHMIKKR
jgi:hypothetical protein